MYVMKLEILKNLGLSEKSAKVYLAALGLGTAAIQEIAKKAEVKQPTAYLQVEELLKEGLLEKIPSGKKDYFKATDPTVLEKRAEQQLKEVKSLVPELQLLQSEIQGRPRVSIMEGRKAIEQVYQEVCQANSIRFWSDLRAVEEHFLGMFHKIGEAVEQNEIRTREIIADTPEAKKSSRRYAVIAGKTYSSRVASKPGIQNDNAIYGDTVALFRIHQNNLFVILIEEPTIASTMKAMFDMAWESAEPFIGR